MPSPSISSHQREHHDWSDSPAVSGAASREIRRHRKALHEMKPVLELLQRKAPQRFSHIREPLRIVGMTHDGTITKGEMQNFFRAFGVTEDVAGQFFRGLAGSASVVSYKSFVKHVCPYLQLPGVEAIMQSANLGGLARPPVYNHVWYNREGSPTPSEVQKCRRSAEHLGLRKPELTPRPPSASVRRSLGRRPPNSHTNAWCIADIEKNISEKCGRTAMDMTQRQESVAQIQETLAKDDTAHFRTEDASAREAPDQHKATPEKHFGQVAVAPSAAAQCNGALLTKVAVTPSADEQCNGPLLAGGRPIARPFGQRSARGPAPNRARNVAAPL